MKRILIVDDEVIIATQLEERLSSKGYHVVGIANCGEEAVGLAGQLQPDLILMDVVMPGRLDGIAAAEEIHRRMGIPVIFVTAFANAEFVERAKLTEPFGYILKPFRDDQVLAAIEIAVYKKEMQDRLQQAHDLLEERVRQRTSELSQANAQLSRQIAERMQAEQALKESEEHLRSLMESATHFIVFRLGLVGEGHSPYRVVFASPSIVDILGISDPENFADWFSLLHPDDATQMSEALRNGLTAPSFDASLRIFHPRSESWRWIQVLATRVPQDRDPPAFINGIILDITARKNAEEALRSREHELAVKSKNLEEMNTALKVLLKKRDEDRTELEEKVLFNVRELIAPFLEKLHGTRLEENQKAYLEILAHNLEEITSPFSRRISSKYLNFTPTEIQIANMVKQGKSNKDIAQILNISRRTVESHRDSIRHKLGIKNMHANLRTHLLSIQ